MQDAFIFAAKRTPIGRFNGALARVRPDDLLAHVFSCLMESSGAPPQEVSEVFAGCANQAGEDNRNIARMAWLIAGFPYEVPALTVNRLCASGLDAVAAAVRSIWVGDATLCVAGGVESMSRAPYAIPRGPYGLGHGKLYDTTLGWRFHNSKLEARFPLEAMGETAENIVARYGISRQAQDAYALQSHQRAVAADFSDELVPVEIPSRKGAIVVDQDEGPRPDTSLEKLAKLRPAFRQGGTVTAGNASTLNDGAAAVLVGTREVGERFGMTPMARVAALGSAGVDPQVMGLGPVPATQKALARAGLNASDLDLTELNEAFAAQALAVMQDLELDPAKTNVNGGAIALGHPLGCSGTRILTTLLHAMPKHQAKYGLATLCVGVGQGSSMIVERI